MTHPQADEVAPDPPRPPASPAERTALRPETVVALMAVGQLALAGLWFALTPGRGVSIEGSGWLAFLAIAALFGLFEYTVFNVQFRREGIAFGLSEIPLAFGLVFLAPLPAMLARLPFTLPVLVLARKNTGYKLLFNVSIFLFEMSLASLVFRRILDVTGTRPWVELLAVVGTLTVVAPFTSVLIAIAISRFEGNARERVVSELRATWWLYVVNTVLGAMTVALALIEPWLVLLAAPAAAGIWFVLHSYGEMNQELRDLDAVHGFTGRVGSTLDVDEIGDVAVEEVVQLCRAESAALVRFSDAGSVVHTHGAVPVSLPTASTDPGWRELLGTRARVAHRGELHHLGIDVDATVPALLVAPVADDTGTFALLVAVQRTIQATRFDDADVARIGNIAEQLSVSLRRGMLHAQLEWEARHDALTGLPARTLFERYVGEAVAARRPGRVSGVLMLDLDRFKEVNDTLGHHAGDDLLRQFAGRMGRLLEPGDVLARLAGDEFAILCHRSSSDDIVAFARSCVLEGGRPVVLDNLEIVVTVSVGAAEIGEADTDAIQPMRRADIAMYNAKWQRTGVESYRDEIDRRTPARLSMLGDLRTAIETDELHVVYQPKLDLTTGRIVGAEALVRWEHASRGVVAPIEFVRVAEDTGLIKDLTDLVLARGIEALGRFHAAGIELGLAVNLSTHDLFDTKLPERVRGYLAAHRVAADALTLEITESSLFVDAPRTRATIDELHDVGIRMAVDDFGTGYSSLSYLRRLPVHELKIDQSFVGGMLADPQDEVIVRSTVDLGHNLGLRVVAEGAESLPVLERLIEVGCDVAQGYVISPPIVADELIEWVRRVDQAHSPADPISSIRTLGASGDPSLPSTRLR